jgi:hypothetical protein
MRPWKPGLLTVIGSCLIAATTLAADAKTSVPKTAVAPQPSGGIAFGKGVPQPEAYGTSAVTRISVMSYAFQGTRPFLDDITDDGFSYRTFNTAGSLFMAASVSIPAGATITAIGFDNCDNTASDSMSMTLYDNSGDHTYSTVATVASTDAPVCGFNSTSVTPSYDNDSNVDHAYELYFHQTAINSTLKFRSAYVEYMLRVSPAPAVATFPDVPTSDFGFQYIEALNASGITGGCGGGLYCPDAPVTRRQMGIFIAKALGLHWPN